MIPFMIVDDERLERILIKESFSWQEESFELVGEAGDGEEGLALYMEKRPALIITDINMPFMDGLAFAKEVKRVDSQTEIIVLTGFDEFDYAQLALNIGVDSFLLKPISRDDIQLAAQKAKQKILMRRKLDENIKESFLLRLAYGRVSDLEFEERTSDSELAMLKEPHYCVYCLHGGEGGQCREAYRAYRDMASCQVIDLNGAVLYWVPKPLFESAAELAGKLAANAEQYHAYVGVHGYCQNATEAADIAQKAIAAARYLQQKHRCTCLCYEKAHEDRTGFPQALVEQDTNLEESGEGAPRSRIVRNAVAYIGLHFCDPQLSLRTLARDLYINDSYLSRIFKSETQKRVSEYILEKRIQKACELLRTTDMKVYQIAEQVGFQDPHYFGQCFKKQSKLTVNEYRSRFSAPNPSV